MIFHLPRNESGDESILIVGAAAGTDTGGLIGVGIVAGTFFDGEFTGIVLTLLCRTRVKVVVVDFHFVPVPDNPEQGVAVRT
jgi:hypothetical protein